MDSLFACGGKQPGDDYVVSATESRPLKILLVGDSGSGKTKLVKRFKEDNFSTITDSEDNLIKLYDCNVTQNGQSVKIVIYDPPARPDDTSNEHKNMYSQADVIILCFDICNQRSLKHIETRWLPELKSAKCAKNFQFLLVGNKRDDRERHDKRDSRRGCVTTTVNYEDGISIHDKIKSCVYLECSAKENINVEQVFNTASLLALRRRQLDRRWFKSFDRWNRGKKSTHSNFMSSIL